MTSCQKKYINRRCLPEISQTILVSGSGNHSIDWRSDPLAMADYREVLARLQRRNLPILNQALTHKELIDLAVKTLEHRYELVAPEFTPYKQRLAFDFIALSRHSKEIRIIECKSNRADFLGDGKWQRYLPYCTHLAFLGSKEVFSKDELPSEIGVIRPKLVYLRWKDAEEWQWYYERGCRRLHDVAEYEYQAILEGFLGRYSRCSWRCQNRK